MTKQLTPAELEVLAGLAAGKTVKQIAAERFRSIKTIETQRSKILKKLNIPNVVILTHWALRHGVVLNSFADDEV